jgi:hypothetical protein
MAELLNPVTYGVDGEGFEQGTVCMSAKKELPTVLPTSYIEGESVLQPKRRIER